VTTRLTPPAGPNPRGNTEARAGRGCDHGSVGLTIVIVDDHAGFRSFGRACLEADGFTVLAEAADGASAVEACQRFDPDVVLLDVVLPDFDGFEVCARLTERGNARPAVVLTSSRPAASYTARLQASTAQGFVPKEEICGDALRALLGTDR
jgi:DNA-binding NarL/FixJ family response regulator